MTVLAFSTLSNKLVVSGAALFNLMRNFGSSLFISISILILLRTTAANYSGLVEVITPMSEWLNNSINLQLWGVVVKLKRMELVGHLRGDNVLQVFLLAH